MKKIKIELTQEQQKWLLRLLNREWYEELEYQANNDSIDDEYLEALLDVYIVCLGKPKDWVGGYINKDDIESKMKELKAIKEGRL